MTDLSAMSDDALKAAYAATQQAPASPLAGMSDDDLKAAYAATQPPSNYSQYVPQAISDIPRQALETTKGMAKSGLTDVLGSLEAGIPTAPPKPGEGFFGGLPGQALDTVKGAGRLARGLATLASVPAGPAVGSLQSLIGHPLASVEHGIGTLINPAVASKDDPNQMYDQAADDVAKGLMTIRPGPKGPTTAQGGMRQFGDIVAPKDTGPVTSSGLKEVGAPGVNSQQVASLEQVQRDARRQSGPYNQNVRDNLQDILSDPNKSSKFSPGTQDALQTIADGKGPLLGNSSVGDTHSWGLGSLMALSSHVPYLAEAVTTAKALAGVSRWKANLSVDAAINNVKSGIAQETPPAAPPAPPPPPDPQQLKLQMDALVNQVNVRNRDAAAQQQQTVAQAQPLLKQLAARTKAQQAASDQTNAAQLARVNAWAKMATDLANQKGPAPTGPAADLLGGQSLGQVLRPPAPPPAPPEPPAINPLALPASVTKPAAVIMNGLKKVRAMKDEATAPAAPPLPPTPAKIVKKLNGKARPAPAQPAPAPEQPQVAPEPQAAPVVEPQAPPVVPPAPLPPAIGSIRQRALGLVNDAHAKAQARLQAEVPPEAPTVGDDGLPRSDYSHLTKEAAAALITARALARGKIESTASEYHRGTVGQLAAKERIADAWSTATGVEHQDINAQLQHAKTIAGATKLMDHYIAKHPSAASAIRAAMDKHKVLGWPQ